MNKNNYFQSLLRGFTFFLFGIFTHFSTSASIIVEPTLNYVHLDYVDYYYGNYGDTITHYEFNLRVYFKDEIFVEGQSFWLDHVSHAVLFAKDVPDLAIDIELTHYASHFNDTDNIWSNLEAKELHWFTDSDGNNAFYGDMEKYRIENGTCQPYCFYNNIGFGDIDDLYVSLFSQERDYVAMTFSLLSDSVWHYEQVNDDAFDVPEPSTLAIFALGIIGLASRRFKR
ncbi:PEP-CTERM sorting domain-containing protein [Colwelliaceae bacterium 6441]